MDVLDSRYITEQNKIASSGAWIWLLEIITTGQTTLRFANNNSNVRWPTGVNEELYYATSFSMDDLSVSTSGKFPEYRLQISEVDLSSNLRGQIKETGGLTGSTVRLMVVHSDHLNLTTPAIDELVEILNCELVANAVVFTIGIPSLLSKRFPRDRYVPSFCRHKFTGALCGYVVASDIYTLTSSQISFTKGDDYNTVWVNDGGLLDLFSLQRGRLYCPGNLLHNGDFEYYDLSGWDIDGNAWVAERSSERSKFGSYSYKHRQEAGSQSSRGISQGFTVEKGKYYSLSGWVWCSEEYFWTDAYIYSSIGPREVRIPQKDQWVRFVIENMGPASYIGARIYLGGDSGYTFFDGICLVEGATAGDYTASDPAGLNTDVGFIVSGSKYNDGFFRANRFYGVDDKYVRVFTGSEPGMQEMVTESAGNEITLTVGYENCDHTLGACKLRNNSQNYGGSPGIAGGVYG